MTPYRAIVRRPDSKFEIIMSAISKDKLGYNHLVIKSVQIDVTHVYDDITQARDAVIRTAGKTISKNNSTILGYYDIHFNDYTKEYEVKGDLTIRAKLLSMIVRSGIELYCMKNGLEMIGGI